MAKVKHGGDIYAIASEYGFNPEDVIDFSGNINPLGTPDSLKKAIIDNVDILSKYPDPEYNELRGCISDYTRVKTENIIVGSGSTELISLFFKVLNPDNGLVLMPTYSEYEREIRINGGGYEYYRLKEEEDFVPDVYDIINSISGRDILVICNPNNPTGVAIETNNMERILKAAKDEGCFVFVDETYAEFADDSKNISSTGFVDKYDNLFVIRGISKFFGTPGLRIGYGLTSNKKIIDDILRIKDPWTVGSVAQVAGQAVFKDKDYQNLAKKCMHDERDFILDKLAGIKSIKVYNSDSNFFLCKILDDHKASDLRKYLLTYAIDIRDAASFPYLNEKFFRFCILSREDNEKLVEYLNRFFC
jgi:threonine-phosphate decarboxylase